MADATSRGWGIEQADYRGDPNLGGLHVPGERAIDYGHPIDGIPVPPQDDLDIHVYDLGDGRQSRSLIQPAIDGFSPDSAGKGQRGREAQTRGWEGRLECRPLAGAWAPGRMVRRQDV